MYIQLKIKHRMGFCSDSSVDITFPIHFVWEKHFFCKFVTGSYEKSVIYWK